MGVSLKPDPRAVVIASYRDSHPAVIARLSTDQLSSFRELDHCNEYVGPEQDHVLLQIFQDEVVNKNITPLHPSQLEYVSVSPFTVARAVRERSTRQKLLEAMNCLLPRYWPTSAVAEIPKVDPNRAGEIKWEKAIFGLDIKIAQPDFCKPTAEFSYKSRHAPNTAVLSYTLPVHKVAGFEGFITADQTGEYIVPTAQRLIEAVAQAAAKASYVPDIHNLKRTKTYVQELKAANMLAIRLGTVDRFDDRLAGIRIDAWKKAVADSFPSLLDGLEHYYSHQYHCHHAEPENLPRDFDYDYHPRLFAKNADSQLQFLVTLASSQYRTNIHHFGFNQQLGKILALAREERIAQRGFDTRRIDARVEDVQQKVARGVHLLHKLRKQASQMREEHGVFMFEQSEKLANDMAKIGLRDDEIRHINHDFRPIPATEFIRPPF